MRYFFETFWRHSLDVCTPFPNNCNFLHVCQSVSWLTSLLKLDKYRDISNSRWDIFLKLFGDIPWIFSQYFQINTFISMSVSLFVGLLPEKDISSSGLDIFLKFFGDIPGMLVHLFQISLNFLYVCQSATWLSSLLILDKYKDISNNGWYIYLNLYGDIDCMLVN